MGEIRCGGCGEWFPAEYGGCQNCGWERPGWNRALHVAKLNSNLYDQANAAVERDKWEREMRKEEIRMAKRYGIEPGSEPSKRELIEIQNALARPPAAA